VKALDRSERILELLEARGRLSLETVCHEFGVSEATARRAFASLQATGRARRIWGGIEAEELPATGGGMRPTRLRLDERILQKAAIAKAAARLVKPDQVLFIDGGSTTYHLARSLGDLSVRIVTNSLLIAYEIDRLRKGTNGAEVFLTGGFVYPHSGLLVGPEAVASIGQYRADISFLSTGGLDKEGASNNHQLVVEVEQAMAKASRERVLLADASKFGHTEMVRELDWDSIDFLVTDKEPSGVPADYLSRLIVASEE